MMIQQRLFAGGLLAVTLAASCCVHALAADVTGKVKAIFHEPVVINQQTFDKVSVTIHDCATNKLVTGYYAPGHVSDDNALGALFRDTHHAATSNITKNQYMQLVNGHATLTLNDTDKTITKTTLWGYNWESGKNVGAASGGGAASANSGGGGVTTSPAAAPAAQPAGRFGGLGGAARLGRFGR